MHSEVEKVHEALGPSVIEKETTCLLSGHYTLLAGGAVLSFLAQSTLAMLRPTGGCSFLS